MHLEAIAERFLLWALVFFLVGILAWQANQQLNTQNNRFDQLQKMHDELRSEIRPIREQLATHGVVVPLPDGDK